MIMSMNVNTVIRFSVMRMIRTIMNEMVVTMRRIVATVTVGLFTRERLISMIVTIIVIMVFDYYAIVTILLNWEKCGNGA